MGRPRQEAVCLTCDIRERAARGENPAAIAVRFGIPRFLVEATLEPDFHPTRREVGIDDPETGCHALVRATGDSSFAPERIYADSALVSRHAVTMTTYQGRTVRAIQVYSTNGVSLRPIRRVSGEPCPGMLPTVNGA